MPVRPPHSSPPAVPQSVVRKVRDAVTDDAIVYLVPLDAGFIGEFRVSVARATAAMDAEMDALAERWRSIPEATRTAMKLLA